jgi:hypothetical protein
MNKLITLWSDIKQKFSTQLVRHFKYIYLVLGILSLLLITMAYLYSPKYDVVKIKGTEVKRTNKQTSSDIQSKDVYYIYTIKGDSPLVLRNEDALVYFKFNSADIQTLAQDLEGQMAQIKHYGFRSTWFSVFPNVTHIGSTTTGQSGVSIFLWFNLLVVLSLLALLFYKLRQLQRRLVESGNGAAAQVGN